MTFTTPEFCAISRHWHRKCHSKQHEVSSTTTPKQPLGWVSSSVPRWCVAPLASRAVALEPFVEPMNSRICYRGDWRVDVRKDFILDPSITVGAKAVYIALKAHCAPDGDTAFPSSLYLAKCLGVSRDTVIKYVAELREAGWVATEQRGEAGRFTHTLYTVLDRSGKNPLREKPVAEKPDTKIPQKEEDLSERQKNFDANASHVASPSIKPVETQAERDRKARHNVFMDGWCEAYPKVFGAAYAVTGRDAKAVKGLVTPAVDVGELVGLATSAWNQIGNRRAWHCQRAVSIHYFAEHLNEIRAELRGLKPANAPEDENRTF